MYPGMSWANADPVEVAKANERVTALLSRLEFEKTHDGFKFALPWHTDSGQWEVTTPADGVLSYPKGDEMMQDLWERYPV